MYYKHKKFAIEKNKLAEINTVFDQHDLAELGRVSPKDARQILRMTGFEETSLEEIINGADPEFVGSIRKEMLLESIRLYLGSRTAQREMSDIYETIRQFCPENSPGIDFYNLRMASNILGEALSDYDIKEMMSFADPNQNGFIDKEGFIKVMKKTAIW